MHYMHYKDYIHHDFYVYSPVLLTQYLGHCWHTPCTELYILRISAWLLRKPPLPCHRGGEPSGWGGVWGSLLIYTYVRYTLVVTQGVVTKKFTNFRYHPTGKLDDSPLDVGILRETSRFSRISRISQEVGCEVGFLSKDQLNIV